MSLRVRDFFKDLLVVTNTVSVFIFFDYSFDRLWNVLSIAPIPNSFIGGNILNVVWPIYHLQLRALIVIVSSVFPGPLLTVILTCPHLSYRSIPPRVLSVNTVFVSLALPLFSILFCQNLLTHMLESWVFVSLQWRALLIFLRRSLMYFLFWPIFIHDHPSHISIELAICAHLDAHPKTQTHDHRPLCHLKACPNATSIPLRVSPTPTGTHF